MADLEKSKGHVIFSQGFEFIHGRDGALYKAPLNCPIGMHGFRSGARFECEPREDGHVQYLKVAWAIDLTGEQD